MYERFVAKRPRMISPYAKREINIPNFYNRINNNTILTGVNIILIDGRGQVGKSTLGDEIAGKYDPEYDLCYTTKDIVEHFKKLREKWKNGEIEDCLYRWIFWDEPQLEIPRMRFWSERNLMIQALTSSFGFLKPSLILALPNVKGISDMIVTNILFRITVKVGFDRDKKIVRKGYIKLPKFNEIKNKFYWTTAEIYTIPELTKVTEKNSDYMKRKMENFFNTQLSKWEKME